MNKIIEKTKLISTIALILLLSLPLFIAFIPTVDAQRVSFTSMDWTISHEIIGVNQPLVMGVVLGGQTNWASNYGVDWSQNIVYKVKVWPEAYVRFTRPDGTTRILQGPFDLGIAQRPRFEFTPDAVGTWKAEFIFPGDQYFNQISTNRTFVVQAQEVPKRTTWAVLSTRPDTVIGLGQTLLINGWVTPPPITGSEVFEDVKFTVTKPSGTSFTVGPMWTEGPGTVFFDYPMDELGNWTIAFQYPGNYHNRPSSTSKVITVQQELVPMGYPDTPLPNQEWTFPINIQNREWRNIAGPWYQQYYAPSQNSFNPYTEGPRTAHMLWELDPIDSIGGYIGSPHSIQTGSGEAVYNAGDQGIYSSTSPAINVIMAGRGYYTSGGQIFCIDMRTGEKLWNVSGTFNVGGTRARVPVLYSFGTTFRIYNAISGAQILNTTGMAAAWWVDPYVISLQAPPGNPSMSVYNYDQFRLIKWDTSGTTTNFTQRIVWNVTNSLPASGTAHSLVIDNLIIARRFPQQTILTDALHAVNLTTGQSEYITEIMDWTKPDTWVYRQGPAIGAGDGTVYFAGIPFEADGYGYYAFTAATGKAKWVSENTNYPWGEFYAYLPQASGYGMNYALSYDGVYAMNLTNGKIVWHYRAEDPYHETPYNQYVFGSVGSVVGGGVLYAPSTEHSPTLYYRGQSMHAIDVFTGDALWTILGDYQPLSIAYGVLVAQNRPNGYTYGFGKGATETTLTTQNDVITEGSNILLKGKVLDMSTAQKGTPAIADEYMTPWMEYLHMQQPKPADAKGVEVVISVLDSNNNSYEVGRTTSDASGQFALLWQPEIAGQYTITAAFTGSEAYYGSTAVTQIGVAEAPQFSVSTTPAPQSSMLELYFLPSVIGIIAAIVIVGAAMLLMLRKR